MKILINRNFVEGPWGGGNNFVKAFYDYIPSFNHTIVESLYEQPDVIFLMDPRGDKGCISINDAVYYKREAAKHNKKVTIIQRVNECDARKGTSNVDEMLQQCSEYVDKTVFVSEWMKEYHLSKGWRCKDNHVLVNGVSDFYKPGKKIDNGKINIVTHHWSDNVMKGFDYYEMIDDICGKRDDITFTYIGRERGTFKNTIVIPPLFGEDLAKQLGKYDLYVTASRFDPGPNHVLEAIASGITVFAYKEGGGACEFAGEEFIFNSFEELVEKIELNSYNKNNMKIHSWKKCMEKLNENILLKC